MELEEWTKIEVDFGYPKNAANESHILSVLEKIEAEATVSLSPPQRLFTFIRFTTIFY